MRTRKTRNKTAWKMNGDITFNPSIISWTSLAECFRIFIDLEKISDSPASQHPAHPQDIGLPTITVYTDGACYYCFDGNP
jgi:hypothetical protein